MWPAVVVEAFPFSQFLIQIHVVGVAQKLIEFVLVGSVLNLTDALVIQLAHLFILSTSLFLAFPDLPPINVPFLELDSVYL